MSHDKAAPKFMKPGDDPELDRLLEEARGKESEPPGEYYYDMFGRRRRVPAVDGNETKEKSEKGAPAGVVTEARPAAVLPKRQALWLALGALAIVGPVGALALGAFQPRKGPQSTIIVPLAAASTGAMGAAPTVDSGAPAPKMSAAPAPEEDAGATPSVTATPTVMRPAPSSVGVKLGPKPKPKSTEDPYAAPSVKPRKPDPGSDIW